MVKFRVWPSRSLTSVSPGLSVGNTSTFHIGTLRFSKIRPHCSEDPAVAELAKTSQVQVSWNRGVG